MDIKAIEEMGAECFYAHSYCSHERGSNENNNKLVRRFIKKGMDIGQIGVRQIKRIQDWMNSMPRKMFNGKSADEVYTQMRLNSQNS